jgi:FMN phosphatase YigB (HAD superfamily)
MKKVVFIDWNKTLSFDLFWGHLSDVGHPNHKHLDAIEKWLFVDNRSIINPWMKGKVNLEKIVNEMSNDTGIDSKIIIDELKHSCEIMTFCFAGIEELIEKIRKRGILVVVATDNMDTFSLFTAPALKLDKLFDDVLNSHVLGYLKDDIDPPDKILFFDAFLEKHNLSYEDSILLDDSPDSSGKYKKLGFNRELIDGPEKLERILESFAYGR